MIDGIIEKLAGFFARIFIEFIVDVVIYHLGYYSFKLFSFGKFPPSREIYKQYNRLVDLLGFIILVIPITAFTIYVYKYH